MVSKLDLSIYVYNYAAVVSGAYVVLALRLEGRIAVFGTAAVIALLWTAYFNWSMTSTIVEEVTGFDMEEFEE